MLRNQLIPKKTYQERIDEALNLIPLYSREWTNFNPSDPGITILESLSMFETLQQEHIEENLADVSAALLKMTGFEPEKGRPARLLLKAHGLRETIDIPNGQSFTLGDIQYESVKDQTLYNCNILAAYTRHHGYQRDVSYILDGEASIGLKVFGDHPEQGDAIYLICDNLPPVGEEMYFYVKCARDNRNEFAPKENDLFARIEWECYTANGFEKLDAKDNCGGFLVDSEIRMKLRAGMVPAVFEEFETKGYCLRGHLIKCNYDKIPRLTQFEGFLTEVWQRNTKSFSHAVSMSGKISIRRDIADQHYNMVFAREAKGQPYHKYEMAYSATQEGRYYDVIEQDDQITYSFSKADHGYAPDKGRDSIRILSYDEDTMRQYRLGTVLGYDRQEITLPFQNIVFNSFSILAKRHIDGEDVYDFVKPGHSGEGDLYYSLAEREGIIRINQAGDFIGAELFMGSCATNLGDRGNVRAGNTFRAKGMPSYITFTNPIESTGGCYRESLSSVKERFIRDIDTPFASITTKDYEELVQNTPGLCIGKVRAIRDAASNQVKLTILPTTGEERPKLREDYKQYILDRVNQHRVLCTKVSIIDPEYVAVHVNATVYVKPHYDHAEEQLKKRIYDKLNFVDTEEQFGDALSYEDLFRTIEREPYVSFVYDLKTILAKPTQGRVVDQDIVPVPNGLIVPGKIKVSVMVQFDN